MQIESDFIEDVRAKLATDLQQLGYSLPVATGDRRKDAHRICVDN